MARNIAHLQTFFVKDTRGDESDRVIVVKVNGEAKAVQINDPMLWEALEAFRPIDLGLIGTILAVPSDTLRAGVVLSPEFMARNFMRDTLSGFIQSRKGMVPLVGTIGGFKQIATRSDAARLYRAFGGAYGDMWKGESAHAKKIVERMARRGGFAPWTVLSPRGVFDLLERIGSISEAGTRVAEFKKTMKPGNVDSLFEAAFNAREVSVDFGLHGHSPSVRSLTRIAPFSNPAIQGFAKMGRTGHESLLTTLLRGSILTARVPCSCSIGTRTCGRAVEEHLRHFDIGLKDELGQTIPVRFRNPTVGCRIRKHSRVHDPGGDRPEHQGVRQAPAEHLRERVRPARDPHGSPGSVELWGNANTYTDRPIVPESRGTWIGLQYNAGASLTARELGEAATTNPAKIDHASWLLRTLGTYATTRPRLARQVRKPPSSWLDMPVVRAFVHDRSIGLALRHRVLRTSQGATQNARSSPAAGARRLHRQHRGAFAEHAAKVPRDGRASQDSDLILRARYPGRKDRDDRGEQPGHQAAGQAVHARGRADRRENAAVGSAGSYEGGKRSLLTCRDLQPLEQR